MSLASKIATAIASLAAAGAMAAGSPGVEHNTQSFLEALEKGGGKPMEALSPADARQVLIGAQKGATLPAADVSEKTITVDGRALKLTIVRPAGVKGVLPVFMFFHGGGWILGDFPTHERFVRDLVVDYSRSFPNARIHVSLGNQLRCMDQLLSGDISLFVAHEIEGLSRSTGARLIPLTRVGQGYFAREGHALLSRPRSLAEVEAYPAVTSSLPEVRHQRFFETWSRTTSAGAPFDQGKYVFASNSLAACLDYVERSDAVIGHTEVMEGEFIRRGLRRIAVTEQTRRNLVGIYVLEERAEKPRVAELIARLQEKAAQVLPALA